MDRELAVTCVLKLATAGVVWGQSQAVIIIIGYRHMAVTVTLSDF